MNAENNVRFTFFGHIIGLNSFPALASSLSFPVGTFVDLVSQTPMLVLNQAIQSIYQFFLEKNTRKCCEYIIRCYIGYWFAYFSYIFYYYFYICFIIIFVFVCKLLLLSKLSFCRDDGSTTKDRCVEEMSRNTILSKILLMVCLKIHM